MNSLTVKALTAFIVTTGLVLMWTPVGVYPTDTTHGFGFDCSDDQKKSSKDINQPLDKCVDEKYGKIQYDSTVPTTEHCCASFEHQCIIEKVYTKVGCKSVSPNTFMQKVLDKCKKTHNIAVSAVFCATLPSAQKPLSDDKCKEYMPCDPLKSDPVNEGAGGGSGGNRTVGESGGGSGGATAKNSSDISPKVNSLLMTFIAITSISLLFIV